MGAGQRLMGGDEEATLATLNAYREVIDRIVADHRGRVFGSSGDSAIAEFSSPVEAVRCAVEIQQEIEAHNANLPKDRRMRFRIGINLGDVMAEGDNLFGDGVNVAARLEALCESGGVALSGNVHEHVQGKLDERFEDAGEHELKNIARPIRVWRWSEKVMEKIPTAPPCIEAPPLPDKPSIAVLPLTNMSGDPEQEYFSDGMAEEIITALSRYRWFFVIARNSSFTYKGRAIDVTQVAKELGVRYVLEGSVRKASNRIRVTAQLIDAETGNYIWTERYDRRLGDIFALQDEITETIVAAIEPELGVVERERARRKPPDNLDAWGSYQRGLSHFHDDLTGEGRTEAKRWFQRACELDPQFAAAYADLAWAHTLDITLGCTDEPKESLEQATRAAEKAVALDNRDATAHFALGRVYILRHEYKRAIAEMETALALNASFDRAYYGLGMALLYGGQPEESIPQFERAIRLSPRSPRSWTYPQMLACAFFNLGQYEEAASWSEKAVQHPNAPFMPFLHAAAALGHLGRLAEASAMLTEVKKRKPDFSADTVKGTVGVYGRHSGVDQIVDGLRKAGLLT